MEGHRSVRWGGRIRRPLTVELAKGKVLPTNPIGKVDADRLYVRVHGSRRQKISVRRLPGDQSGMMWPRFRGEIQHRGEDAVLVGTLRETKYCAFSWILWGFLAAASLAVTVAMVTGNADAPWYIALMFAGLTLVLAMLAWVMLRGRDEGFDTFGGEVEDRLRAWAVNRPAAEITAERFTEKYLREEGSEEPGPPVQP